MSIFELGKRVELNASSAYYVTPVTIGPSVTVAEARYSEHSEVIFLFVYDTKTGRYLGSFNTTNTIFGTGGSSKNLDVKIKPKVAYMIAYRLPSSNDDGFSAGNFVYKCDLDDGVYVWIKDLDTGAIIGLTASEFKLTPAYKDAK